MPTGFTAGVADGTITDLRGFALVCARQFGACIMQRDDPTSDLPKLREESPHYGQMLREAQARAAEFATMSLSDARKAAEAEYEDKLSDHKRYAEEKIQIRNRYNAILSEVIGWQPPTSDHQALKDLMIQQLTESRKFDCDYQSPSPMPQSAEKWLAENREKANKDCDYYTQHLGEERERVAKSNAWIIALYESLNVAVPSGGQGGEG